MGNARSANFPGARRRSGPKLPVARLRRLGVPDGALTAFKDWWAAKDSDDDRQEALSRLSVLSDGQLAALGQAVPMLGEQTSQGIEAWARRQPDRALAAELATAVEQARGDQARAGLLNKLEMIRSSAPRSRP